MNDKRPTRKEREREARSHLILDIARDLIARDGYAELSMHAIAEIAEYSKGTIYLHYGSRESVLTAMCIRALLTLKEMHEKAVRFQGSTRERIFACRIAHRLFAKLHPIEYACVPLVKTPSICEKIDAEEHAEFDRVVTAITGLAGEIAQQAVERGDLSIPDGLNPNDLAFSLFALHGGNLLLCQNAYLFRHETVNRKRYSDLEGLLFNAMLDGLGWKPHSSEYDEDTLTNQVLEEVFAEEQARLQQDGESDSA